MRVRRPKVRRVRRPKYALSLLLLKEGRESEFLRPQCLRVDRKDTQFLPASSVNARCVQRADRTVHVQHDNRSFTWLGRSLSCSPVGRYCDVVWVSCLCRFSFLPVSLDLCVGLSLLLLRLSLCLCVCVSVCLCLSPLSVSVSVSVSVSLSLSLRLRLAS